MVDLKVVKARLETLKIKPTPKQMRFKMNVLAKNPWEKIDYLNWLEENNHITQKEKLKLKILKSENPNWETQREMAYDKEVQEMIEENFPEEIPD